MPLEVETTGETVGEAKWLALRELEKRDPGIDKAAVEFQVVSEGQRGLLGVGYAPARVIARVEAGTAAASELEEEHDESDLAGLVRDLLDNITAGVGVRCRVEITEDDETVTGELIGGDLGLLIGKHGQTIDSIQYLVNTILYRTGAGKQAVVDAAGYRERRQATLDGIAVRAAESVVASGEPVELEPMTAIERKHIHVRLKDYAGVSTSSDGVEPNRFVVVAPA